MTIHSLLLDDKEPPLTEFQKLRREEIYGFKKRREFQEEQKNRVKRDDHILLRKDAEDGYTASHWESVTKATHRGFDLNRNEHKKQQNFTKKVVKFLSSSSMAFGPNTKEWYEDKSVTHVDYDRKTAEEKKKLNTSSQRSASVGQALTFTDEPKVKESDYAAAYNNNSDRKYRQNDAYVQYSKYLRGTHFSFGNGVDDIDPVETVSQSSYRVLPAIGKVESPASSIEKKKKSYTSNLFRADEQLEADRVDPKDNVSVFRRDYLVPGMAKVEKVDQEQLKTLRASHFQLGNDEDTTKSNYKSDFHGHDGIVSKNSVVKPDYKSYVFQFEENNDKNISCAKEAFQNRYEQAKNMKGKDLGALCKKLFTSSSVRLGNEDEYVGDRKASVTSNDYLSFSKEESARKSKCVPLPSYPMFNDDNEDYRKGGSTARDSYMDPGRQPVVKGKSKRENQKENIVFGNETGVGNSVYHGDFKRFEDIPKVESCDKKPYKSTILNPEDEIGGREVSDHYTSVQTKAFRDVADAKVIHTVPIKPAQGGNHYFHEESEGGVEISECHDKFIKPERMENNAEYQPC